MICSVIVYSEAALYRDLEIQRLCKLHHIRMNTSQSHVPTVFAASVPKRKEYKLRNPGL